MSEWVKRLLLIRRSCRGIEHCKEDDEGVGDEKIWEVTNVTEGDLETSEFEDVDY